MFTFSEILPWIKFSDMSGVSLCTAASAIWVVTACWWDTLVGFWPCYETFRCTTSLDNLRTSLGWYFCSCSIFWNSLSLLWVNDLVESTAARFFWRDGTSFIWLSYGLSLCPSTIDAICELTSSPTNICPSLSAYRLEVRGSWLTVELFKIVSTL